MGDIDKMVMAGFFSSKQIITIYEVMAEKVEKNYTNRE